MAEQSKMLNISGWVIFSRRRLLRVTMKPPALEAQEKAIRITLVVPATLFQEPVLAAQITLDGDLPLELKDETVATLKQALLDIPHLHVDLIDKREPVK